MHKGRMTRGARRLAAVGSLLLVLGLPASPAPAAEAEELRAPYYIYGAGTLGCAIWNQESASNQEQNPHWWQLREWLFGYLSAHSLWGDDSRRVAIDKANPGFYLEWVTTHCREHPGDPIHRGASLLIEFLIKSEN